ncbi:MAG: multicopper oxidase domain-containing protein, partial [Paracoccaceae bacterium]|nr:multicopper oxidase domain-containing protein [Paracoccaceae bacterium]
MRLHAPLLAAALAAAVGAASAAEHDIVIGRVAIDAGDLLKSGIGYNGQSPGPVLRFREGEDAVIRVTNTLDETTSIHWHGFILPYDQDGVEGHGFDGIAPGETFTYRFPVRQAGTYWYHSHSRFQEQTGAYGPLVIDPKDGEPFAYDRDYPVVLSDWSFEDPETIFR